MDRAKAKRLLNKKGWTGKEVGQAYLYSLAEQTKAGKAGIPFKPPFTREDLDRMEQSITVQEQYIVFRAYASLYSALVDSSNMAEGQAQQMYSGFYRYLYTLKDCIQADNALAAVEKYPLIMTRCQYERIKAELIKERKAFKTCFYSTIIDYIENIVADLDKAPTAIKKAIEATKKQPCTNSRILSNYNNDMGEGYYTLPDGTRSDKVTSETWQQKLEERFLATHELTVNGEEASSEENLKEFNIRRIVALEKLFFEGIEGVEKACKEKGIDWEAQGFTLEELLKIIEKEIDCTGSIKFNKAAEAAFNTIIESNYNGIVWHTTEEMPDITKYDVLEEPELMHRYRGALTDDAELEQQKTEFIEDYPDLYKATVKELKKLLPTAAKLKEEDYLQPTLTYGDIQAEGLHLYDYFLKVSSRDILDYYYKEETTANMQKRLRFMYSGLAIIEEDSISPSHIADNGDYKEEQSNPYLLLESIDSITDDEERLEEINHYKETLIKPALKYVYAYNTLVDTIAAVYDVNYIESLKKDMSLIESQLESGFNGLLYGFYSNVFGTEEEKARKRELIKQVFSPIYIKELLPDPKRVQEVKKRISASYGKSNAISLVRDLHPLTLEIMGQEEGT